MQVIDLSSNQNIGGKKHGRTTCNIIRKKIDVQKSEEFVKITQSI